MSRRSPQLFSVIGSLAAFALSTVGRAEEQPPIRVLFGETLSTIDGAVVGDNGELWVPSTSLKLVDGFELKPEGLCSASQCVPVPKDSGWVQETKEGSLVSATAVAVALDQAVVSNDSRTLWAFGEVPTERMTKIELGQAPDFALPDRKGNIVRLSDYRGKKVLLLTWASWCKCSLDLPRWQKVYEDLKDQNFEIIAVAEDTAGEAAAGKYYEDAHATYVTLIDAEHAVSALYQMVNVPTGVWIDEEGHVVRPPEVAYTAGFRLLGQTVGDDRYEPALRDWVAKGSASEYVMTADKLKEKLSPRSRALREAELHFRLGTRLFAEGDKAGARVQWQAAQKLAPENWNYHRQDWSFDAKEAVGNWLKKVAALDGKPYYAPLDLPAK